MTIAELHKLFLESTGVCTDTRKLKKGQLYFALKGENFNGNAFAKAAIKNGAAFSIIDESEYSGDQTILFDNALEALQKLASYHRNYLNIPIIGLTGSNGKTTTKELINAALSQKFKTTATIGNLNNHIGVPLTLLSMTEETEIGIVEMGANHQGEIALLSSIAQPNYGYITNFGKAHLEGFGGVQGVIKGKSELYEYLRTSSGTAFINTEDVIQVKQSQHLTRYTFGNAKSDVPLTILPAKPFAEIEIQNTKISSQLIGAYNGSNIAAATAIAIHFNIALEIIKKGIESYTPANNRSQIIHQNDTTIILDAYNANPTSMEAALRNLAAQNTQHTIAFLGDMFEVGETVATEHQNILDLAQELSIDYVYAVGPSFGKSIPKEHQKVYSQYEIFEKAYKKDINPGTTILIKGSRGMAMERILKLLD